MPYRNKQDQREYQRAWVAARRLKYIGIHGGMCRLCGSDRELEFDHVNRAEKLDHRIWSWSVQRIEAELAKCQLLCCECHREKSKVDMAYAERKHGTNLMYLKERCRCNLCRAAHAEVNAAYR